MSGKVSRSKNHGQCKKVINKWIWALPVLVILIGIGWFRPKGPEAVNGCVASLGPAAAQDRLPMRELYRQSAGALTKGEYLEAERLLERAVQEGQGEQAARALAAKMALTVAYLAAEVRLADEYRILIDQVPDDSRAYRDLVQEGKRWITLANRHLDRLFADAVLFRDKYYREGFRLESPLAAVAGLRATDDPDEALLSMRGGETSPALFQSLSDPVYKIALAAVFQEAVVQPPCADVASLPTAVLSGTFVPEALFWLVGSKMKDVAVAHWYLERVLEMTSEQPDNPYRLRAEQALKSLD